MKKEQADKPLEEKKKKGKLMAKKFSKRSKYKKHIKVKKRRTNTSITRFKKRY